VVSAASLAAAADIGYEISLVSFGIIGLALYKYVIRSRELRHAISSPGSSAFLDIYSPIILVSILTLGVVIAMAIAIQKWEASRYS
jgi:hypothetical protein